MYLFLYIIQLVNADFDDNDLDPDVEYEYMYKAFLVMTFRDDINPKCREAAQIAAVLKKGGQFLSEKLMDISYSKKENDNQLKIALNTINVITIQGIPLYLNATKILENAKNVNNRIFPDDLTTTFKNSIVHFQADVKQILNQLLEFSKKFSNVSGKMYQAKFDKELVHKRNDYGANLLPIRTKYQSVYDILDKIIIRLSKPFKKVKYNGAVSREKY